MLNPSQKIGPYTIVRELGRGGEAIVYLARDPRLDRAVAIKVTPRLESGETGPDLERELAATANLEHPSICPIHDVGITDAFTYVVMAHIDGETLADRIRRDAAADTTTQTSSAPSATTAPRARVTEMVELMERVARALHVAHESGLVHGDLKPHNIMIEGNGTPVLVDFFGTRLHRRGGTPAYLAPEQLQSGGTEPDCRTDVYALGVTLFESLALRRPFDAPTREALYRTVLTEEPPPLRHFEPRAPRDLAVVLEVALDKDPRRRYPTALAFAEDLRRVLDREPIRARPAGRPLRVRRALARHRAPLAVTGVLVAALATTGWTLARARAAARASSAALASERATFDTLAAERDRLALLLDLDEVQNLGRERAELLGQDETKLRAMADWAERARAVSDKLAASGALDAEVEDPAIARLLAKARALPAAAREMQEARRFVAASVVRTEYTKPYVSCAANTGDLDGDGRDDLLLGHYRDRAGSVRAGGVSLVSGRTGVVLWSHATDGGDPNQRTLGRAVAAGVDLDRDGTPDLVAGRPGVDKKRGAVFAWSGRDHRMLFLAKSPVRGCELGHALATTDDLDGDGHPDLLAGAPAFEGRGAAFLVSGKDGAVQRRLTGRAAGDRFGHSVASIGDLDGDDVAELIVGAHRADSAAPDAGSAYVYSGRTGQLLFERHGQSSGGLFGWCVAAAGDVDADGVPDFMVGADWDETRQTGANAGAMYVFSGRDGRRLLRLDQPRSGGRFGYSACALGDLDGDGHGDLIVSAPGGEVDSAFVFSGKRGERLATLRGPRGSQFGIFMCLAGDVDGDSHAELVVAAASPRRAALWRIYRTRTLVASRRP